MAERLKNTLSFVNLAPETSIVLLHGLQTSRPRPLAPDVIFIPSADLTVVASDEVSVTLMNQGPTPHSGSILVEAWHTIERAFKDVNEEDLPVKPYVVVSAESNAEPPQPPFDPSRITIYARPVSQGGSDLTGNGTLAKPYATFQRAVRDVPSILPPGVRYYVDITGITEVLPTDYRLPAWSTADTEAVDLLSPYFVYTTGVNISATPQLTTLLSVADATIPFGNIVSQVVDPITAKLTITIAPPRPAWGGNALAGKQAQGTANGFDNGTIYESDATSIKVMWPFPLTAGPAITIVEPSAYLTGTADEWGCLNCFNSDSLTFRGISVKDSAGGYGLTMVGEGINIVQRCVLESPDFEVSGNSPNRYAKSWITGFPFFSGPVFTPHNFFDKCLGLQFSGPVIPDIVGCVFDGCDPVDFRTFTPGGGFGAFADATAAVPSMNFSTNIVRNGTGDGVRWHGSCGVLQNCDIYGNAGNGVTVDLGHGVLEIKNCLSSGAPNGGVGVRVNDGMFVKVDAATSGSATPLTGVGGGPSSDMQVGVLPIRTWANFTGAAPIRNQYDLVGMNAGATDQSTGSRLYETP